MLDGLKWIIKIAKEIVSIFLHFLALSRSTAIHFSLTRYHALFCLIYVNNGVLDHQALARVRLVSMKIKDVNQN